MFKVSRSLGLIFPLHSDVSTFYQSSRCGINFSSFPYCAVLLCEYGQGKHAAEQNILSLKF